MLIWICKLIQINSDKKQIQEKSVYITQTLQKINDNEKISYLKNSEHADKNMKKLLGQYKGKECPAPKQTPLQIEFFGENTIEYYQIDGKKIMRAINKDGHDLGMEWDRLSDALMTLELSKHINY